VVGTRRATVYGKEVTRRLVADLVRHGLTVVSGLARGIDTVAHRAAVESRGRTIAVLACGLDIIYPPENEPLARRMVESGALVSEHPLGTRPRAEFFPRRNRIMSGLSLGTLVIEADQRSGALITARLALEQDREVFAVPGSILSPASRGTNLLIREGAKPVLEAGDVLEELNLSALPHAQPGAAPPAEATDIELKILEQLEEGPRLIDEISRATALPVSTVSGALTMLELKGMVIQLGTYYAATGANTN